MPQSPLNKTSNEMSFEDKKALPELLLKQQIAITDRGAVISAFRELEYNRRRNNGIVNKEDKASFESTLIQLFLDIKDMIKCKSYKSMNNYEKSNYNRLISLVNGQSNFKMSVLTEMMSYLLTMLHQLNITNLLVNEQNPFKEFEQF